MSELAMLDFIQANLRTPLLDSVMVTVSAIGNLGMVWLVVAGALALVPGRRRLALAVLVGVALAGVCCEIVLKPVFTRLRPCDVNTAVQLLVTRPGDYSFPSGHTTASFAAVGALAFGRAPRRIWIPSLALASLIAFSRLYLYLHYPTDIVGGIVIGLALGLAASRIAVAAEGALARGRARDMSEHGSDSRD